VIDGDARLSKGGQSEAVRSAADRGEEPLAEAGHDCDVNGATTSTLALQGGTGMQGLMVDSYAWRLEAAVWTAKQRGGGDELRCRPRLLLVMRSWGHEEAHQYGVIGFIEYDAGGRMEGRAAWLVYYYPKDVEGLWAHHDETKYGFRPILSEGEKRFPRPSAAAAVSCLLELTDEEIPRAEREALAKIGTDFLPTLQKCTDAHVRRHVPPGSKR
jgi:hypothetical protein